MSTTTDPYTKFARLTKFTSGVELDNTVSVSGTSTDCESTLNAGIHEYTGIYDTNAESQSSTSKVSKDIATFTTDAEFVIPLRYNADTSTSSTKTITIYDLAKALNLDNTDTTDDFGTQLGNLRYRLHLLEVACADITSSALDGLTNQLNDKKYYQDAAHIDDHTGNLGPWPSS